MRVERRQVTVDVITREDLTTARAVLAADGRTRQGIGDARCKPTDFHVSEIGDELAIGRALVDLGTRLFKDAEHDIASTEGRAVSMGGVR